ncbi:relaxase/mobilization nuclease domain-containing protein [Pedobacter sp. 22226]|uniref:relaxase/mobilization nuclease domain-containing protein n=1 Tax=Pedobacter sp. 22226 TaxID=3453894 RepID=UPI003F854564
MVVKIRTGKKIAGVVYYNEDKVAEGKAILLAANCFATDPQELTIGMKINRFQKLTRLNERTKTNAVHISLNFHRKDELNPEDMVQIAHRYMEGIGFDQQPYLIYAHKDAHHPHLHIATTNIQSDGSRISLHDIGKKISEPVRRSIEQEFGLTIAEGQKASNKIEKIPALKQLKYGEKAVKKALSGIVRAVKEGYAYSSFSEFNAILKTYNATAIPGMAGSRMEENKGLLYAILDKKGTAIGVPIKASSMAGKPILRDLEQDFVQKSELKTRLKPSIKNKLDMLLAKGVNSMADFQHKLSKMNIDLVLSRTAEGKVFGMTYIDHDCRVVIKGSELGKAYSALGIASRLQPNRIRGQKTGVHTLGQQNHKTTYEENGIDVSPLYQAGYEPPVSRLLKRRKKKKRFMGREQQR